MATDALIAVQASTTQTDSFDGADVSLPTGTPRSGLWVRVLYSDASVSSGDGHFIFNVEVSHDGGSTYFLHTPGDEYTVTLGTDAVAGEIWLPLETSDSKFRLSVVFTDDGSAADQTITYQGDLVFGRPS